MKTWNKTELAKPYDRHAGSITASQKEEIIISKEQVRKVLKMIEI